MAYQVLSRKWRPQKFQDVVGQQHITQSLVNALKQDTLGHAYLFTGTRGIGKTTVARIFAKALRCENLLEDGNPCNICKACLDFNTGSSMNVYEIDGASNNSVDDIRDLISNVQYLPTTGRFKVYIIDEVHMLSTSAFNALLKTLEEPPEHVMFLFATTEPHKLLETVLSRCQRFDFKNATDKEISFLLEKIAKEERISFQSSKVLKQLANQGKGSFRDTLSLLDQVLSFSIDKNIDEETMANALGLAIDSEVKTLLESILVADTALVHTTFNSMLNKNVSLENILRGLLDHLYFVIENIDNSEKCSQFINLALLEQCLYPELFWIYESFSKDFSWVLTSLAPENAAELVLKKVSMRREFFQDSNTVINFGKKNSEILEDPVPLPELEIEMNVPEEVEEPIVIEKALGISKSYEGLLEFVSTKSPATSSNLEQGNIVNEPHFIKDEKVEINISFADSASVFFDFLNEKEVFNKVKTYIAEYYDLDSSQVFLDLELIKNDDENENFISVADIRREEDKQNIINQENNIKNNPMLREAEKLFGAKVDKVVLNEKD